MTAYLVRSRMKVFKHILVTSCHFSNVTNAPENHENISNKGQYTIKLCVFISYAGDIGCPCIPILGVSMHLFICTGDESRFSNTIKFNM